KMLPSSFFACRARCCMRWNWLCLNRSVLAGALATALLAGWCGPLAAQQHEGVVERVEHELETAAHSDADTHKGNTDPLSVDPDVAIWTVVVFVVLLMVLKKFAWGPILQAVEGREHHIADQLTQAERSNEEAKRLLASYETKLADAANEVRALLDE